jgi:hypothetical protein
MPERKKTNVKSIKGLEREIAADFERHAVDTTPLGFHGDRHLMSAVALALTDASAFIETGTNEGRSLAYAARLRPQLPMRSCELFAEAAKRAAARCAAYPNVQILIGDSVELLPKMVADFDLENVSPVFWLDAHGPNAPLPLGAELRFISETLRRAHVFIDDFQVPGRPWFGFDAYPDGRIGLEYAVEWLKTGRTYLCLLPSYRERTSTHHPLRGWCCLSWGQTLVPPDMANYERRVLHR